MSSTPMEVAPAIAGGPPFRPMAAIIGDFGHDEGDPPGTAGITSRNSHCASDLTTSLPQPKLHRCLNAVRLAFASFYRRELY